MSYGDWTLVSPWQIIYCHKCFRWYRYNIGLCLFFVFVFFFIGSLMVPYVKSSGSIMYRYWPKPKGGPTLAPWWVNNTQPILAADIGPIVNRYSVGPMLQSWLGENWIYFRILKMWHITSSLLSRVNTILKSLNSYIHNPAISFLDTHSTLKFQIRLTFMYKY